MPTQVPFLAAYPPPRRSGSQITAGVYAGGAGMVQTIWVESEFSYGPYQFDAEKAVEALLYAAPRAGFDLYRTLKTIYYADRLHLSRYGRFIYGDYHSKVPFGPVPQHAYDILKHVGGRQLHPEFQFAATSVTLNANTINALRKPDLTFFSQSELDCLEAAAKRIESMQFDDIKRDSHGRAFDLTGMGGIISPMMMASEEQDSAALIQFLEDSAP